MPTQPSACGVVLVLRLRHRVLSLALSRVISKLTSKSVHDVTKLHMACSFFSSLFSRHGPFIVPGGQLFHRSNGFTQFCTRLDGPQPISTNVCFCLFCTSGASSVQQMFHHLVVECGIPTVSKIPILQICNAVVVLKQSLASFQHLHKFVAVRNFFILRSPSCARSCTPKKRVSMCFVLGLGPNRSVKEFALELSLRISTFI